MKVQEIMTSHPTCATPDMSLEQVARMMADCDCGAIPVVESQSSKEPIGIITDRDIVIRSLGRGRNPMDMTVRDCMTTSTVSIDMNSDLRDAARMMREHQIRRLIVIDGDHRSIVGIVAQADIALEGRDKLTGSVVEEISEPVGKERQATFNR